MNCREFLEDTENLVISPSSSDSGDQVNQSLLTDKCSVRDAIIKSLKKKRDSPEEKKSGIFDNAEQKYAIEWQLKKDMDSAISPDIRVCKVTKPEKSSSEKIKIKPFPVLNSETASIESPIKNLNKKVISVSRISES